jgi:BirA family biotin operon repressor/biotin-[acetyl-CoA-carboxylase] ligase
MNLFVPIEEQRIRETLNGLQETFLFHIFNEIDSTNRYLKEVISRKEIQVCCAETQTNGRGRFDRHWASPFGENIYLSIRRQLKLDYASISTLGLVVAMAVLDGLQQELAVAKDFRIKWPNDLLWEDKKLCGILIEIVSESNGLFDLVIGIGVNVNTDSTQNPLSLDREKRSCSLFDITGKLSDRNALIAHLLVSLDRAVSLLINEGFSAFLARWQDLDYLTGKYIHVSQMGERLSGRADGINHLGQLRLVDDRGLIHYLSSGDASLT